MDFTLENFKMSVMESNIIWDFLIKTKTTPYSVFNVSETTIDRGTGWVSEWCTIRVRFRMYFLVVAVVTTMTYSVTSSCSHTIYNWTKCGRWNNFIFYIGPQHAKWEHNRRCVRCIYSLTFSQYNECNIWLSAKVRCWICAYLSIQCMLFTTIRMNLTLMQCYSQKGSDSYYPTRIFYPDCRLIVCQTI